MKKLRILVVEDSVFLQATLEVLLKKMGHEVEFIDNGPMAIEVISENCYDIVLLDCQLPIISGYEVAAEIRDRQKKGFIKHKNIIIACTANSMAGDEQKCLDAGMDDYLQKPISEEALRSALEKWV